jgi:ribosome-interacting GTPase 1
VRVVRERLREKRIALIERWPGLTTVGHAEEPDDVDRNHAERDDGAVIEDPFRIELPTLLIGNKRDLDPDPGELEVLEELLGVRYPAVATSATTGDGLDAIGPLLFEGLEIVRVYTKAPSRPPDEGPPFTVRRGQTILDVARLVHKDVAAGCKFARIWGSGAFDGQQVGPEHTVADGDVVELHTS